MIAKILSEKLFDQEQIPSMIGILVSAASGTVAGITMLENIQIGTQILAVVASITVSIFTIRYLIIKTKNLNK